MIKHLQNLALILAVAFLLSPSVSYGAVLESNEGSSIDMENFGTGDSKGQSFQHGFDFTIDSVEIWGGLGDSPATSVDITIYESDYTTVVCTENIDVSGWSSYTSPEWQILTINCPNLTQSTTYIIDVLPADGSSNDGIRWATSNLAYPDGEEYYGHTARSTRDTMFIVNGTDDSTTPTTTATTTEMAIFDASQTWFNAILLFYLTSFFMIYLFRKRR